MVNVSLHMVHTISEKHANTPGVETNVIYLSFPPYKIFLYYIWNEHNMSCVIIISYNK